MELGVEDRVRNPRPLEQSGQQLALLHAGGAHEHRLADLMTLDDVVDDRGELGLFGAVHQVGLVLAAVGTVGRNRHHTERVGGVELGGFGGRGTGHAGELVVHAEVVLQRDRGQSLVLGLDRYALFGLDGLVQPLVVTPPGQDASGVLVDDDHLAVEDHVVPVAGEQLLGFDRVVEETHQRGVLRGVEVVDAQPVLCSLDTFLGDSDRALLDVDFVVLVLAHGPREPGEIRIPLGLVVGRAGDDQRGSRFVDEDRVDLVDDGEVVTALHEFAQ